MKRPLHGKAFVLPLVIIMSVVMTILIVTVLERQGSQQLSLARQAREYRELHFGRGVREVLDMWMRSQASKSVRDALGTDGKALDIQLADGTTLSLFLSDVQGSLLGDTSGLIGEDLQDLSGSQANLVDSVSTYQRALLVRPIGPISVSVMTAPVEVLTAVARQVVGSQYADDLVRGLLELRDKPHAQQSDLSELETTLSLSDQQKRSVERMFAVEPTFFRLRLFAYAAGASSLSAPIARYEAFAIIPRPGQQRGSLANEVKRRSTILGWKRLEVR